jgi:hypothetical protein
MASCFNPSNWDQDVERRRSAQVMVYAGGPRGRPPRHHAGLAAGRPRDPMGLDPTLFQSSMCEPKTVKTGEFRCPRTGQRVEIIENVLPPPNTTAGYIPPEQLKQTNPRLVWCNGGIDPNKPIKHKVESFADAPSRWSGPNVIGSQMHSDEIRQRQEEDRRRNLFMNRNGELPGERQWTEPTIKDIKFNPTLPPTQELDLRGRMPNAGGFMEQERPRPHLQAQATTVLRQEARQGLNSRAPLRTPVDSFHVPLPTSVSHVSSTFTNRDDPCNPQRAQSMGNQAFAIPDTHVFDTRGRIAATHQDQNVNVQLGNAAGSGSHSQPHIDATHMGGGSSSFTIDPSTLRCSFLKPQQKQESFHSMDPQMPTYATTHARSQSAHGDAKDTQVKESGIYNTATGNMDVSHGVYGAQPGERPESTSQVPRFRSREVDLDDGSSFLQVTAPLADARASTWHQQHMELRPEMDVLDLLQHAQVDNSTFASQAWAACAHLQTAEHSESAARCLINQPIDVHSQHSATDLGIPSQVRVGAPAACNRPDRQALDRGEWGQGMHLDLQSAGVQGLGTSFAAAQVASAGQEDFHRKTQHRNEYTGAASQDTLLAPSLRGVAEASQCAPLYKPNTAGQGPYFLDPMGGAAGGGGGAGSSQVFQGDSERPVYSVKHRHATESASAYHISLATHIAATTTDLLHRGESERPEETVKYAASQYGSEQRPSGFDTGIGSAARPMGGGLDHSDTLLWTDKQQYGADYVQVGGDGSSLLQPNHDHSVVAQQMTAALDPYSAKFAIAQQSRPGAGTQAETMGAATDTGRRSKHTQIQLPARAVYVDNAETTRPANRKTEIHTGVTQGQVGGLRHTEMSSLEEFATPLSNAGATEGRERETLRSTQAELHTERQSTQGLAQWKASQAHQRFLAGESGHNAVSLSQTRGSYDLHSTRGLTSLATHASPRGDYGGVGSRISPRVFGILPDCSRSDETLATFTPNRTPTHEQQSKSRRTYFGEL